MIVDYKLSQFNLLNFKGVFNILWDMLFWKRSIIKIVRMDNLIIMVM